VTAAMLTGLHKAARNSQRRNLSRRLLKPAKATAACNWLALACSCCTGVGLCAAIRWEGKSGEAMVRQSPFSDTSAAGKNSDHRRLPMAHASARQLSHWQCRREGSSGDRWSLARVLVDGSHVRHYISMNKGASHV